MTTASAWFERLNRLNAPRRLLARAFPALARAAEPAPRRRWSARALDLATDLAAFATAMLCAVLAALLSVGIAAGLSGCGGGVETEGTGSFSSGPITGFGSIIVNGVHYDESQASIADDDALTPDRSGLALGMMVQVSAGSVSTDSAGRQQAAASSVRVVRALLGPAADVDAAAGRFTVLGQAVAVQADTVIDSALGGSLAGVANGATLQVFGSFDDTAGVWRATRVAAVTTGVKPAYSVRGTVGTVDRASQTFTLNGRTYSTAGLPDAAALVAGADVRLSLKAEPDAHGHWVADGGRDTGAELPKQHDGVQWQGLIRRIDSATRLLVEGTLVDLSAARINGTPVVGALAKVSGSLRNGVLVASELTVTAANQGRAFELEGVLTSVDSANKRLVLRGVTVSWARADLVFAHGASAAALPGYTGRVHIEGLPSADRSMLEATLISFDD